MRYLKFFLSALFILLAGFLVFRSCAPEKTPFFHAKRMAPQERVREVPMPAAKPRMAIILDDWGQNASVFEDAAAVGRPLTLSILPHLRFSRDLAQKAHAQGLGVMLHMPMQPLNTREPLEPHTILTTTPEQDIIHYLDEALKSVPYAEGVNNHMGSAATADARVMKTVIGFLKGRGLFFVDSRVTSASAGPELTRQIQIPFARRDVFIDNTLKPEEIQKQLRIAVKIALLRGRAVVIGHDHPVTLRVIRQTVPEIESAGVQLVLVRDLVGVPQS